MFLAHFSMGSINELIHLHGSRIEEKPFSFITQCRKFFAVKFLVSFTDYSIKEFFQKHGIIVEYSESLDILWPPVFSRDSITVSDAEKIYLSTSFELIPNGNINANDTDISSICEGVSEISLHDRTSVVEKNVNCTILQEERVKSEPNHHSPEQLYEDKYTISNNYKYYLFDKRGCTPLLEGATVYLSKCDHIAGYKNGHVKVYVKAKPNPDIDKKVLLQDIIKYHPQSEPFDPDDFMDIEEDEAVLSYIESCYRSGQINTVIKQYIKEGLI